MAKKPHEDRVVAILHLCEPDEHFTAEQSMPRAARAIDCVVELSQPSPVWGPLRSALTGRTAVVEHYSRPPRVADLARALTKLAWVHEHWRDGRFELEPALVVLSDGRPCRALATFRLRDEPDDGVFRRLDTPIGDLLLVDLRNLTRTEGTSVLRLMARFRSAEISRCNLEHLLGDRAIPDRMRRTILEAIMAGTLPVTDEERALTWEAAVQEGVELGKREGIELGKREGIELGKREGIELGKREGTERARQTLLRVAKRLVAEPAELEALRRIEPVDELEKRVLALLRPAGPGSE